MPRSNTILVAVDPAGCAHVVVEEAARLAADLKAPVVLVTSIHVPEGVDPSTLITEGPLRGETALHALKVDAEASLAELLELFRGAGVDARSEILVGDPAQAVVERAQRGCRMLVLGTHGRTGLSRLFFGSVAENIVRHAPCPVLTIRAEGVGLHPSPTQRAVDALADG